MPSINAEARISNLKFEISDLKPLTAHQEPRTANREPRTKNQEPRTKNQEPIHAMAGDWIKFEHTTPDKPEVIRLATRLGLDQDAVTGKLLRLWIWADQNSVDGVNVPVTRAFVDRLTGCPGFTEALAAVGWLSGEDGVITLSNFTRHNGTTAKARANSNRRMAKSRAAKAAGDEAEGGTAAEPDAQAEAGMLALEPCAPAPEYVPPPSGHGAGALTNMPARDGSAKVQDGPHGSAENFRCAAGATFSSPNAQPEKRREEKKELAGKEDPPAGAGWPASEAQARALAVSIGADADYVATVWLEHDGTGDYHRPDICGVARPIGNFASYVKSRWNYRLRRTDEAKALEKTKAELRQCRATPPAAGPRRSATERRGQRPEEAPAEESWARVRKL